MAFFGPKIVFFLLKAIWCLAESNIVLASVLWFQRCEQFQDPETWAIDDRDDDLGYAHEVWRMEDVELGRCWLFPNWKKVGDEFPSKEMGNNIRMILQFFLHWILKCFSTYTLKHGKSVQEVMQKSHGALFQKPPVIRKSPFFGLLDDVGLVILLGWSIDFVFVPECVARVPVSFGGLGVRLCSRKVVSVSATVRNRSPTTATVCVSAISSPQWRVRQEWSRKRVKLTRVAAFILVFAAAVSVWLICVAVFLSVFAADVSVWLICVAVVLLVFAEEVFVWVICGAAVILVFAEELSVWLICVAAVLLAFAEELSVWAICVAAVILVFAAEVSVRVICVAAVLLVFAEEVSVRVICVAAVILASVEEVSVRVICGAAIILVFAEEVSVWHICVAAIILASAAEVSVWVICVAAVILVFAEEVSVWVICVAAIILVFAEAVSLGVCRGGVGVSDLCPRRVSSKSVLQRVKKACQVRVSDKSVLQESQVSKSVKSEVSRKSVAEGVSSKSVK